MLRSSRSWTSCEARTARSRARARDAWADTTEYDRLKVVAHEPRTPSSPRKCSQSRGPTNNKRRSRSRPRTEEPGDEPTVEAVVPPEARPKAEMHTCCTGSRLSGWSSQCAIQSTIRPCFLVWAESIPFDPRCPELRALTFLEDGAEVAGKVITLVLYAMVNCTLGGVLPFPESMPMGLTQSSPHRQSPLGALFPEEPNLENDDVREKARAKWEELCSWLQYWWEAGEAAHHPTRFFGGLRHSESRINALCSLPCELHVAYP